MSFVRSLTLTRFRNYDEAEIAGLGNGFVVLTGANGAGKTNALEAVSLLTPGRGLRNAKIIEIGNLNEPGNGWSVSADAETSIGTVKIGTGTTAEKPDRRIVRVNGVDLKAQGDLSDYISAVWLTPQMDGLFIDTASARRRFFDRLVYAFDAAHAGRINRYDTALAERSRLLRDAAEKGRAADPAWLKGIEKSIAETGISIAAARVETLEKMQKSQSDAAMVTDHFPVPHLALEGYLEQALAKAPALQVEEEFERRLEASRGLDAHVGGTREGPHKTDLIVTYADKNMPAAQCSTGEQKALLTGLVLAHAARLRHMRGNAPVLLLDEIAAHFDENRKNALFSILSALGGQVWVTGTDASLVSPSAKALFPPSAQAVFVGVENNRFIP